MGFTVTGTSARSQGGPPGKASAVFLIVVLSVVALLAGYSAQNPYAGPGNGSLLGCDVTLEGALQISSTGVCLQNLSISISPSNGSELVVPVIVMSTGSTGTLEVLYLLNSQLVGAPVPHRSVTASQLPVAISVPGGQVSHAVVFSNASLVVSNKFAIIYSYTVTALEGSAGYYAILPPYYFGIYPALAVGVDPDNLNSSALSMWGYSGTFLSSEVTIPSEIVGTYNAWIVNTTIPLVPDCSNAACTIISHSGI